MTTPKTSLHTANAQAGLDLANELADHLQTQMENADGNASRPGGTNYLAPQRVPKEIMTGILFYAITMANQGWANPKV